MKRFCKWGILFIVPFTVLSCYMSKKTQQIPIPKFDQQGHRGCRGLMPENTVTAMFKAIDLGATTLEMDVVITADKKVILSHEPFFNHEISTKPNGEQVTHAEEKSLNIFQMSFLETQSFDVGIKPHPRFPQQEKLKATKPLLSDLIEDVEAYLKLKNLAAVFYNIETKSDPATDSIFHPGPEEFVELLMQVVRKKKIEKKVIVQSFDFRTLRYLHQKYPDIQTAALIEEDDKVSFDQHLSTLGFVPTIYSPHFSLVTDSLIKNCHDKGVRIIPWTVNDKNAIVRFKEMGVDGIITDYPNLFN